MKMQSIYSPKVEIRETSLSGKGTFAIGDIKKGEIVYIRGGKILKLNELFRYRDEDCVDGYWPLNDEYWLGAETEEEFAEQKVYVNHSCDANCGIHGEITVVAMRDIKAGEEITQDYGLLDNADYKMKCACGAKNCRGIVTGKDWKRPELQEKYYDYFAQYLKDKIDERRKNGKDL